MKKDEQEAAKAEFYSATVDVLVVCRCGSKVVERIDARVMEVSGWTCPECENMAGFENPLMKHFIEAAKTVPADDVLEAVQQLRSAIDPDGVAILYPADVTKLHVLIAAVSGDAPPGQKEQK